MLPLPNLNTLLYVCLACLFLVVLDASPVRTLTKQDVEARILDAITKDFQRNLANYETDYSKPFRHIWKDSDNEEMSKHRVKRIGIAGHENMDRMMNTLGNRPSLSISGNMGNIQSMMNRMMEKMRPNG
ncbi:uncharacterized protein LOC110440704 [Mizuhopecten yessoensis]|uniref:Uncharacterized protein n=1 Tax=Mizuhopecten yessoensis TaxID=6573 RepID=A0A210R1L0_MIZYE|nr:uncharacterized protein LOC110440704 [Mizuhopecten yessoensis]XP_021339541.1 uncharacterized protein LOC110440704 [Mizuhopecten yessoensis]XP_021339547.1 uncharacterized protein LOC110440704 [Mizuhopecten yessoensis]OWF54765.1 hypothetical protein KP79_PYT18621 [Mizuhopecten yessoensis]